MEHTFQDGSKKVLRKYIEERPDQLKVQQQLKFPLTVETIGEGSNSALPSIYKK